MERSKATFLHIPALWHEAVRVWMDYSQPFEPLQNLKGMRWIRRKLSEPCQTHESKGGITMNLASRTLTPASWTVAVIVVALLIFLPSSARAQSCQTSSDLEEATRTGITAAGQRYFGMAAK